VLFFEKHSGHFFLSRNRCSSIFRRSKHRDTSTIVYPIYVLSGGVFSAEPFLTNGACRTVGTTPPALYGVPAFESEQHVYPTVLAQYSIRNKRVLEEERSSSSDRNRPYIRKRKKKYQRLSERPYCKHLIVTAKKHLRAACQTPHFLSATPDIASPWTKADIGRKCCI
jgi:hypothetical protein